MRDPSHAHPRVGGILLTGGSSRRMGFDKASLPIWGVPLAQRIGAELTKVAAPIVEVGPGVSGLTASTEELPGSGPLVAVHAGARALALAGHQGAALVVACDLPLLTAEALQVLVTWPGDISVVPLVGGHPQPLCARWSAADLAVTAALVEGGARSMKPLLDRPGVVMLDESAWREGLAQRAFADVDTPADLDKAGIPRPADPTSGDGEVMQ